MLSSDEELESVHLTAPAVQSMVRHRNAALPCHGSARFATAAAPGGPLAAIARRRRYLRSAAVTTQPGRGCKR
jgi:hypothetical protein